MKSSVPAVPDHAVRELPVDLEVGVPEGRVEVAPPQEVVEEGPQDGVRETLVEALDLLLGEQHGHEIVAALPVALGEHGLPGAPPFERQAWPADPHAAAMREHGRQGAHQAPRPRLQAPGAVLLLQDDGKAVRDDEEAGGGVRGFQSEQVFVQGVSQKALPLVTNPPPPSPTESAYVLPHHGSFPRGRKPPAPVVFFPPRSLN